MIQNYFDNVKRILGSLISNARAREGRGKGIYLFSFLKIIGSPTKREGFPPQMGASGISARQGKNSCSKKVRASSSNCDHTKLNGFCGEFRMVGVVVILPLKMLQLLFLWICRVPMVSSLLFLYRVEQHP